MTPPVTPTRTRHSAELPILYTADEAAAILRVRRSWLERQAAARRVPFTLLGGCYRFTVAHLHEIVRIFEPAPSTTTIGASRETTLARMRSTRTTSSPLRAKPRARVA